MNIGILLPKKSYVPEAYAYKAYLDKKNCKTSLLSKHYDLKNYQILISFMGIDINYLKKNTDQIFIHEYSSVSTGYLAKPKNLIKKLVNFKPHGRVFQNIKVREELNFRDKIPFIYREMGVDKVFFGKNINIKKEYDIVYSGSLIRPGVINEILRLGELNLKILIIGFVDNISYKSLKSFKNIIFAGKLERPELPFQYKKAIAGLNFTPNIYPYYFQTSTKTLEYLAAGIGVVSNKYHWSSMLSKKRKINFLWNHDLKTKKDFDNFLWEFIDVSDLEWTKVLERCNFYCFLNNLKN